jgi:Tfp pilus assembly protein FimT
VNIGNIIAAHLSARNQSACGTRRGNMLRGKSGKFGFGNERGITLIEIIVVIGLIGILTGVGTVMLIQELPNIRLKEATRELFNDIQTVRMNAVRRGRACALEQLPAPENGYRIVQDVERPDGTVEANRVLKTVNLANYGGVSFDSMDGSVLPGDSGTFTADRLQAQPSGMTNSGRFFLRGGRANQEGRMIDVSVLGRPVIWSWDKSSSTYKKN